MKRTPRSQLVLLPALAGTVIVALWYAVKHFYQVSDWLLPTPWQIVEAAVHERGRLVPGMLSTARGALLGFGLATVSGFAVALLLASSRKVHAALYPWVLVLQMTPLIVLAPVINIWIGPGLAGIVTVTWLISYFPIVANTTQGLLSADMNHVALFRMCDASRWQELWHLRVPTAMPAFLGGLRIAAALAPVGAIFGEFLVGNAAGGTGGLGFLVYSYNTQIKIPALFATALTSCLLGFLFVATVSLLNWAVLHKWHDSFERNDH